MCSDFALSYKEWMSFVNVRYLGQATPQRERRRSPSCAKSSAGMYALCLKRPDVSVELFGELVVFLQSLVGLFFALGELL